MNEQLHITAINNPGIGDPLKCIVAPGHTIEELFPNISRQVQVEVNGELLRVKEYKSYPLSPEDIVVIKRFPSGDAGDRKDLGRTALVIAAQAGAAALTAGASTFIQAGATIAAGAITEWGARKIGLVSSPNIQNNETDNDFNRMGSLTGSRNKLQPYAVVPRVYGKHKLYPPMSAQPYTEVVANKQFLRLLFNVGYGPLKLSEPKIGDTLIGSFDANNNFTPNDAYENIRIDVGESPNLYSKDVSEESPGTALNEQNDNGVRTTQADSDEVSLDVTFGGGLFGVEDRDLKTSTVAFKVEYRLIPETFTASDVDAATDAITISGHKFKNDDIIQFSTGGTLPGGLSAGTDYHIINVSGDDFQVSTTQGGSAVDITGGGSGTHKATNEWRGSVSQVEYYRGQVETVSEPLTFQASSDARETYRTGIEFDLPVAGQYDIRLTRTSMKGNTDPDAGRVHQQDCTWTAMRSIRHEKPTDLPGTVQIGMRIKATDQLNGVLDNFSVVAESRLATYDGNSWDEPTFSSSTGNGSGGAVTSNPAWIFADILTGSANDRAIAKSRLDADALKSWADWCAAEGFEYNGVIDSETTVMELAKSVAAAGRASYGLQDGKHTVVRDLDNQTPVQMFTPRNSWDFSATKTFLDQPHGLKVRFKNEESDWKTEEAIVYNDGYSEDGTGCLFDDGTGVCKIATRFETLELDGVTGWDQAWKIGRYRLAEARLRPEVYTLNVDVEHLVCQRGDTVKVAHDVTLWGSRWGRIKSVTRNASNEVTAIETDEPATMESGNSYQIRIRKDDGTFAVIDVDTVAGETQTLTVSTPAVYAIAKDDLFAFGEQSTETVTLKVVGIEPRADLSARLTLVDEATAIHIADTGSIPAFDPQITDPPQEELGQRPPPVPVITNVRSDGDALYSDADHNPHLRIIVSFSISGSAPTELIEGRFRKKDSEGGWTAFGTADPDAGTITLKDVERKGTYIIQIRARTGERTSDWVQAPQHRVGEDVSLPGRPESAIGKLTTALDGTYTSIDVDLYTILRKGAEYLIVDEVEREQIAITPTVDAGPGQLSMAIEEQLIESPDGSYIVKSPAFEDAESNIKPGFDFVGETLDVVGDELKATMDLIEQGATWAKVNADGVNLVSGFYILDAAEGDLDDVDDGSSYARVNVISVDASGVVLVSGLSGDLDDMADGTDFQRVKSANLTADGLVLLSASSGDLDDINDGTTYGRVDRSALDASSLVLLSATVGDLDDIADGNYAKVLATEVAAGHVKILGPDGQTVIDQGQLFTDEVFASEATITEKLTMGTGGVITNFNTDYKVDQDGYYIAPQTSLSATDNRKRFKFWNNAKTGILGYIEGIDDGSGTRGLKFVGTDIGTNNAMIIESNSTLRLVTPDPLLMDIPTASSATAGLNGDVPSQVQGYFKYKIGGSVVLVPFYNP